MDLLGRIENLKNEGQKLIDASSSTIYGKLSVKEKKRFYYISGEKQDTGIEYTFVKIEKKTGDIYSQSGNKPRRNIFDPLGGIDLINSNGVIVNATKLKTRREQI